MHLRQQKKEVHKSAPPNFDFFNQTLPIGEVGYIFKFLYPFLISFLFMSIYILVVLVLLCLNISCIISMGTSEL